MATLSEKNKLAEKITALLADAELNQADGRHVLSLVRMELDAQAEGAGESSYDPSGTGPLAIG